MNRHHDPSQTIKRTARQRLRTTWRRLLSRRAARLWQGKTHFLAPLIGLIGGGFFARLGLEWTGHPWAWPIIIVSSTLLGGLGALFAWWLAFIDTERVGNQWWPLLLPALYLVWPQRQTSFAMQLVALSGMTVLVLQSRCSTIQDHRARRFWPLSREQTTDGLTFILSLALYVATTSPDILPADSGEFQTIVPLLGVAHPPGYPLYTLVGRLFTLLLPFGTPAYRLNLMSAFLAAATLTLTGAATRIWARRLHAPPRAALVSGLTAALVLSTATTFWAQAGTANVRMPTILLAALGFYALARYARAVASIPLPSTPVLPAPVLPAGSVGSLGSLGSLESMKTDVSERQAVDQTQANRALQLLALALGLGLGHHPSLAFLGLFFLIYLIALDPRLLVQPRRWWKPVLVFLLTGLPLLYLPLRGAANAPLTPSGLDTLDGFLHHVTAQGFEGDMFAYANAQDLPQRLELLPQLFRFQFNPTLLAAAALGALLLLWRDRRLLTLLVGGLCLHTFVSITYRAPQTVEYLMPAYLPLAIMVGLAAGWLFSPPALHTRVKLASALFYAAILLAGLMNGLDHGGSFFDLAQDRSTRAAVEPMLKQAPDNTLILADWHWATPLWYLQWVEGQRPDVQVHYVYPVAGQEYSDTWQEWIAAEVEQRPLILTHAYNLPDYTLEPLGRGFVVHPRPYLTSPTDPDATRAARPWHCPPGQVRVSSAGSVGTGLSPLDAVFTAGADITGDVRLLGYSVNRLGAKAGQTIELTLAWQASGLLETPPSFSVQLLDNDGLRRTHDDRYLGTAYQPGEVRFERLTLPVYPDISPGDYRLALKVYSVDEGGFQNWQYASSNGPATQLELAPFSIHPTLSAPLTLHPCSIPFADGPTLVGVDYDRTLPDTLRLYLHWRGPARGDVTIQVGPASVRLPKLPEDTYQTIVLDLPGETDGPLWMRLTDQAGQVKRAAGPWGWPLKAARLPDPSASDRFVPLGNQMALINVSATPAPPNSLAPGHSLSLRLTFLALKPLVNDYSVSVRLLDATGARRQLHDMQPALGAIPTLKWIEGSRITDLHSLEIPADLTQGPVKATLVVYERFHGTPLPALDGRVEAIPLGEWAIVAR